VIKVEDPRGGDPMRQWGSTRPQGISLSWPIIARNKKSVTCNLRTAEGQQIMRDLVATADVLVENFRPGTLERWGLGYPELSTRGPGLVLARVTGYGQTGPYASRAGFGSIGEAMGGIRHVTGEADRAPSRAGISLGDSLAGTFAALGTVMALLARWSRTLDADDLLGLLHEAGVPAGLTYTAADMLDDPHFRARHAIVRLVHDRLGSFPMQNVAPRLSDTPGGVRWLGPELGEHNDEIYGGLLGVAGERREQWAARGII